MGLTSRRIVEYLLGEGDISHKHCPGPLAGYTGREENVSAYSKHWGEGSLRLVLPMYGCTSVNL